MSEVLTSLVGGPQSPVSGMQPDAENMEAQNPVEGNEPEIKPEAPKVEDKFAAKFAALSRQEKKIKQQLQEFNQRSQAMEAREKEMQERIAKYEQEISGYQGKFAKLKDSPLQGLQEEFGTDFETLTKMQLNEQNPTPEMLIQRTEAKLEAKYAKKLEELESKLEERDKKQQTDQVENAKKQYQTAIEEHVNSGGDKYELIQANNALSLVYEVVEEYYNTHQKVLSVEEASDLVEKHLETQAKKIFELKKFKQASPAAPAKNQAAKPIAPTLSNSQASERPVNGPKKLNIEESKREAAKKIRWDA